MSRAHTKNSWSMTKNFFIPSQKRHCLVFCVDPLTATFHASLALTLEERLTQTEGH